MIWAFLNPEVFSLWGISWCLQTINGPVQARVVVYAIFLSPKWGYILIRLQYVKIESFESAIFNKTASPAQLIVCSRFEMQFQIKGVLLNHYFLKYKLVNPPPPPKYPFAFCDSTYITIYHRDHFHLQNGLNQKRCFWDDLLIMQKSV